MTVTFQVSLPLRLQRSQVLPRLGQAYDDFLFSRISPFDLKRHGIKQGFSNYLRM